jgi:hypothetical protein
MKYINPIHFFKVIISIIMEIRNWRFYWKKMKDLESSGELKQRGLRLDWIKRLYFVKNLEPEALLFGETENGGVEQFEKRFIGDTLKLHNDIFTRDNSVELVRVKYRRIKTKDYYAYLVWIGFRFDKLRFRNWLYLVAYGFFAYFIVLILSGIVPKLIEWGQSLIHFLN